MEGKKIGVIYFLLAILMVVLVFIFASGCSMDFFKSKRQQSMATTALKKDSAAGMDSFAGGSKSTSNTKTIDLADWKRIIAEFPRDTSTTIINNNTYPQPTRVTWESGSSRKEENRQTADSNWYISMTRFWQSKFDSMARKMEESEKNKTASYMGPGLFTLLFIGLGIAFLPQILSFARSYKITKRN